jgi:hypothetical protein
MILECWNDSMTKWVSFFRQMKLSRYNEVEGLSRLFSHKPRQHILEYYLQSYTTPCEPPLRLPY